jgi:hypothetical protein
MRHIATACLITLPLALAACGGGEVAMTNATPEEVAATVEKSGGTQFNPGKWETTMQTVSVDIPGLEGPMKAQMTDMMLKKVQKSTTCITAAQAKSPPAEVIARTQGRCKYENFKMDGGRIEGTLICPAEGMGGEMRMQVAGTFSDDAYTIDNDMKATAPGGPVMSIKARTTGKRIGDCTPEEEKAAETEAAT